MKEAEYELNELIEISREELFKLKEINHELLEACKNTVNELEHICRMLNAMASGETMKQWSRVDPQAILGEIYGLLAPILINNKNRS